MKAVLMLLLAVVVGFTMPACKKDKETASLSGNTFNVSVGKNKALMLKLGYFTSEKAEVSKHPVTAFESKIVVENFNTYYRFVPIPGFVGNEAAEIRIIDGMDTTYNNIKIKVVE